MAKVDLDKLRERLNSDGVIIVTKDELLAAADELALARAVVEAAQAVVDTQYRAMVENDTDRANEWSATVLIRVSDVAAALAAYRAHVGGG